MRTAKRIFAEFMMVVMVLQTCSPTVAAVAAGWQNISSEIATAAAEASDTAEGGETKSDVTVGSGSSDTGAAGGSAEDGAAKDDTATGDTVDSAAGSDSTGDQTEGDDTAADDTEQDADTMASEDAETLAGATITDLNKLVELLGANGAENIVCKDDETGIRSLDVKSSEAFAVLSNADASLYYDAQIKVIITGDAKFTESAKNGMSFQGLGSDERPFEGRIYRSLSGVDSPVELTADRTVFNNLKLTDQNNTIKIKWVGATSYSAAMVASKVGGAENNEESKTLNASVDIAEPVDKKDDTTSALTAPLLGETTGNLTANVTYRLAGPRKNLKANATGNIGLIANTVENGTLTVESVTFPNDLASDGTVETSSGNAGLLVGEVKDSATLSIGTLTNVPTATVQSTDGSAGGVVGLVGSSTGAMVNVTEALDLHALTVKGTSASGGFIGKATNLTLSVSTNDSGKDASGNAITIKPAGAVGSSSAGTYAGGLIGDASFTGAFTINSGVFDFGEGVDLSVSNTSVAPSAGGLFGVLDISNGDVTVSGGLYKSTLQNGTDNSNNNGVRGNYGGLVGKLWGRKYGDALHAFTVKGGAEVSFGVGSNGKLAYAGGLVGYLGEGGGSDNVSAVVIGDATVACATSGYASNNGKYGGAVGVVDTNNVLEVRGLKVETASKATIGGSNGGFAGVVGSSWRGIVKFSGITDLSGAAFEENNHTAQLVYENFNSLIFAAGSGNDKDAATGDKTKWQYKRPTTAVKIDDIYSYGQVIRLGDGLNENLITIDESHQRHFASNLTKTDGAFTLGSADDFAKLAITWQTSGYFSAVESVSNDNFTSQIPSASIKLSDNINLSGTGLTGFTKDRAPTKIDSVDENGHGFAGSLDGGGHTINLAVGEPYGMRGDKALSGNDTSAGNGKIYHHGRLGLFAAINGATVSNVTIGGSMKFDSGVEVHAGSFAATITGNATFKGAVATTTITCDQTIANAANVGGIAGAVTGAATVTFEANGNTASAAQATITFPNELKGGATIGGAIGWVNDSATTVNVTKLTVGGALNIANAASGKIVQAGGLIGCITQGSEKYVTVTGLSFNAFKMTLGKNGDNENGAGGLLGYSWGNTVVTIGKAGVNTGADAYALKTSNNTTVAADNSTEVGGLVYAASGHWIINDYAIDLSGVTIDAGAAKTLGVLVCRGCKVNNKTTYGVENYIGLYLEDKAYWGTAYKVSGITISASEKATFDEWVGNGVKPGSKLMDGDWNAVVSLHTQNGKLDMSGTPASDNSYKNRSSFGGDHKTNGNTRYFYNLDNAYAMYEQNGFSGSQIDTAEKLLLWSAYCYAPSGIRSMIVPKKATGLSGAITITGEIDLNGYSYYPAQPSGKVTVNNANITFHYSDIKAEQNGNKLNSDATQHENMHCGLFRTVANGDLKVTNVTLGGTVGPVINDGKSSTDVAGAGGSSSGALVCRYVYGSSDSSKGTTIRNISIDGLTLNNLIVDGAKNATGADAYMPLLINEMQTYVNLDAKNITATYPKGSMAATSLFGRLGVGGKSDQVTAKFERISLPSQTSNAIFTHSSLLESFCYATTGTGSADYTFTAEDANNSKVTYGSEIDRKETEYSGKQLWYYDETTYGTDSGLVTVDKKPANAENPRFGDYLPYVYKGKATTDATQYHEIRVNQRIPKLVTGCGTYGDPYTVKDAAEMNAIANYINNYVALDGWEVTIAADQSKLCMRRSDKSKTDNEVVYVYKQSNGSNTRWEKKDGDKTDPTQTLSDETMHRYVQSAYYSIEPAKDNKITVDAASFGGFGNKANPFRGVIVGDLGASPATIEIENNNGELRGLIPYSYGSVARNLNINYVNAQATITYSAKDSDGVPTAFFGGVIGCILGGDNIIDGVVVNGTTADGPTTGFTVAGGGTKPHLVPIGGYVGAIAGGGVIFRNMSGKSWRANTSNKSRGLGEGNFPLYDNPYVGRVIDGYAFSEGCDVENGDANYKINRLDTDDRDCITTGDISGHYRDTGNNNAAITTAVNGAQGLLVLSAIISSGAAGGSANALGSSAAYGTYAGSRAYLGGNASSGQYKFGNQQYGKVRNASYAYVGTPRNAASDFANAINDDMKSPGIQSEGNALDYAGDGSDVNSPYLVKKYATWQTGYICAAQVSGMDLQFAADETIDMSRYDMRGYGSGFTGLSGRYYSNACASSYGADRDRIVPLVACINGSGVTIKVKNNTQEYVDDDFCVAGVGGLFGTVAFYSGKYNSESVKANDGANVRNISFKGCDISFSYITTTGTKRSTSDSNGKSSWVGTGCLAGSTANQGGSNGVAYGVFKNVSISDSAVAGSCMAGGLIGSAGVMKRGTGSTDGSIVNYGGTSSPVQLYDCSYSGITVSARSHAGGFVGYINSGACGVWVSSNKTVAERSTISIAEKAGDSQDSNSAAGGIFGLTGGALDVNTGQGDSASQVATISDVSLVVNHNALGVGGIAGRTVTYGSSVNRVKVTSTRRASEEAPAYFGSLQAVTNTANAYAISTGGIIGSTKNNVTINSCTVEKIRMGVTEHAGGLVGSTSGGNTLSANNIAVDGVQFDGARCGGILGNCQGQGSTNVVVTNATVRNCSFGTLNSTWNHGDGNLRNHSGGVVGASSGTIKLANILISKNDFKQPGGQGFLLGDTAQNAADFKGLYAAGVDIVLKDGSDNSSAQKPIKYFNDSAVADVNEKSYIAFGDYNDKLAAPKGKTLYGADAADSTTAAVSPYVTTSPVSSLSVQTASGEAGQTRYLFGDGVNVSDDEKTIQDVSKTIQDDAKKNDANHYIYNNIGGINDKGAYQNTSSYDADSVRSTFNENSGNNIAKDHFLVLVISGNDNTTVKSYLNIITNGGFSDACRLNNEAGANPHVTAKAEVFQLKDGVFVKDDDASNNPTLRVVNNGKNNMSFSPSSDWDNGKGRFTLLTVTFTEAGQSYNVQVPIIVKRKLEIDFTATYDYGTQFKEKDYANLGKDAHVLTSFGEPMTGLLTWTYNSANGKEVDFGWDSYMAAGGSMKGLGKSILFNGADGRLPQGTQLTLIDANVDGKAGGREYHYTVGEGGATSVSLSGNDGFRDSARNPYQERWLSEILDVYAEKDGAGTWAKCDKEAEATAKAKLEGEDKWTLFKVAGADVSSDKRYTLKVPKEKNTGREQRASESVYLVVNVPKSGDGGTQANINGFTASSIDSNSSGARISWNLHHVLRTGGDDNQNGTASTYSILSNYGQEVNDGKSEARTPVSKSTDGAAYVLSLDVKDTVTFSPSQYYTESDHLFYQLDTSLCRYGANNNLMGVSSFPSGTSAIAKFYVAIGGQNYRWNGGDWEPCDASTPAFTQTVTDTGDDSLKLTLDHDLAGIRKIATDGSFTVRTVVEEIRLTPDGCNKVISLSKQSGEDACTKMSYTAKLSTRKEGLNTSSLTQTKPGNVGYYRMDTGDTTITLSAPDKSQLGINVDDLRPIANGTIGLGATYELGGLSNAAEAIANAGSVVYTLALQRRGTDGTYESVTDDISNYVTVTESKLAAAAPSGSTITFTDSKENGKFKTQNGDTTFSLPFTVKVNTQVEQREQFYANYRLVMKASLVKGDVASATPQSPDYVTYTLTRVNLNGIDH